MLQRGIGVLKKSRNYAKTAPKQRKQGMERLTSVKDKIHKLDLAPHKKLLKALAPNQASGRAKRFLNGKHQQRAKADMRSEFQRLSTHFTTAVLTIKQYMKSATIAALLLNKSYP